MTAQALKSQLPTADVIAAELYGIDFNRGVERCPFPENHAHGDKDKSLRYDAAKQRIFCASQGCFGEKGADAIGLVQVLDRVDFKTAMAKLAERYGIKNGNGNGHGSETRGTASPKPACAIRTTMERDGWNVASEGYFAPNLRQVRFEHSTRTQEAKRRPEKTFIWEHRIGETWRSGAGGLEIPIYLNAPARSRDQFEEIILVEGWGKADALAALDIPGASHKEVTDGNAAQFAGIPEIYIWPDKDAAGAKIAARVAELIGKHNRKVFVIEPTADLPKGGDVIDAIALGWDRPRIFDLLQATKPIRRNFGVEDVRPVASYGAVRIDYLLEPFIAVGTVGALTGDSGAGKSSLTSAVCYAIANGTQFAGAVAQRRPVLYLDRENPAAVVAERFQRMGINDDESFKVWGAWCGVEPPGPDSPEIIDLVMASDPKPLLVFDSYIAFHPSGEENDAGATREYMQQFRRLADRGASVLVLHHSGKGENTKDFRGSSDFKAAIDAGWHLANFGEGRLERLRLRSWKSRFSIASDLMLTYVDGSFLAAPTVSTLRTTTELLIDLLKANPSIRAADFETLAKDKGLGRDRAREFLDEGIKAGRVTQNKGPHNTRFHSWAGSGDGL